MFQKLQPFPLGYFLKLLRMTDYNKKYQEKNPQPLRIEPAIVTHGAENDITTTTTLEMRSDRSGHAACKQRDKGSLVYV